MFQYALYWALKKRGRDVGIDLSFFTTYPDFANPYKLTEYFRNIKFKPLDDSVFWEVRERWEDTKTRPEEKTYYDTHMSERWFYAEEIEDSGRFQKSVFDTPDCAFVGCWQTEKYFREYRKDLLHEFELPAGERKLQEMGDKFAGADNTVSVHVRLANSYYEFISASGFHHANIIQEGYYGKAIDEARKRLGSDIQFVVFSDMPERAKKIIPIDGAVYIEKGDFDNYEDWYDMYLMGRCRCNILANSSFSWWSAWLN